MTAFNATINWILSFSYWLLISSVIISIFMKRRIAQSAIVWLLVIYILPLFGIIMYLLFGKPNIGKRRANRSRAIKLFTRTWIKELHYSSYMFSSKISKVAFPLFKLCEYRNGIGCLKGNQINLIDSANETMMSMILDIALAKHNIEMVFYIWHTGGLVNKVAEELMNASRRGVKCRLILDSTGSISFFRTNYPTKMRLAGIDIVEALHVNIFRIFFQRIDLRQHRKMVLIDNHISYIGSMNMVDPRYFKQESGLGQWIDIMVRIEGPVAIAIRIIYSCDWEIETGQRILSPSPKENIRPFYEGLGYPIQVIASGPVFPTGIIHQGLLTSIYSARKKLVMTTPYLVPSDDLLYAICTAAQRGVNVHIIIPRHNNSILVSWASRAFFSELLESGVLIHQFEGGFLHTKSILIDTQLSLIGTVNLDMRSLWLNFEVIIAIDNHEFGKNLEQAQNSYISNSKVIDARKWSKRPYWHRVVERIFYFFSPLL